MDSCKCKRYGTALGEVSFCKFRFRESESIIQQSIFKKEEVCCKVVIFNAYKNEHFVKFVIHAQDPCGIDNFNTLKKWYLWIPNNDAIFMLNFAFLMVMIFCSMETENAIIMPVRF